MKFEVLSTDLMGHLNTISRVLVSKNAMPILENFLFDVAADTLTITASDGDTTVITSIALQNVEGAGTFAVPAKTLIDPLKEMPQQQLRFEVDDENLETFVTYENGKYNFIALNAKEYPKVKSLDDSALSFTLDAQVLQSAISSTLFATSEDDLRPQMTGIYFDLKEDKIVFVASDSKKLVRLINTSVTPGFEASFILPKKPANLMKGIINKEMTQATVTFDNKSARFQMGDYQIICSLIDGRFPRYESVIPKNNVNKLTIDRQTFANVLRRVAVFANTATNQVKFELDHNSLVISAQDIDFSISAVEKVACSYEGTPMQIGFRANFLVEILNTISAPNIDLLLSDSMRAGLIVPVENAENEDLLMLIMPMMLTDF